MTIKGVIFWRGTLGTYIESRPGLSFDRGLFLFDADLTQIKIHMRSTWNRPSRWLTRQHPEDILSRSQGLAYNRPGGKRVYHPKPH